LRLLVEFLVIQFGFKNEFIFVVDDIPLCTSNRREEGREGNE